MKVLTGLIVAILLAAGLVSAPAANAAPYPGTVKTYCHAKLNKSVYRHGVHPIMTFSITAAGSHPKPANLRFTFKRNGVKVGRQFAKYRGGVRKYTLKAFNRAGRYTVTVKGDFSALSVYKDCSITKAYRYIR